MTRQCIHDDGRSYPDRHRDTVEAWMDIPGFRDQFFNNDQFHQLVQIMGRMAVYANEPGYRPMPSVSMVGAEDMLLAMGNGVGKPPDQDQVDELVKRIGPKRG